MRSSSPRQVTLRGEFEREIALKQDEGHRFKIGEFKHARAHPPLHSFTKMADGGETGTVPSLGLAAERLCEAVLGGSSARWVSSPLGVRGAGAAAHLAPTSDNQRTLAKTISGTTTGCGAHYRHPPVRGRYCRGAPPHTGVGGGDKGGDFPPQSGEETGTSAGLLVVFPIFDGLGFGFGCLSLNCCKMAKR